MDKVLPALSRGMLIIGGLLILAGLGWGIWGRMNQPPEPVIGEAGAVVMAVTARELPAIATLTPTATPTATPTRPPSTEGPTPDLLPNWTATPTQTESRPTSPPATQPPPTPTPTSPPPAEEPPTRIVAPAIEMDARVVPMGWELIDQDGTMVSEWIVPTKAAGWHMNSAMPGHDENVVLSGHHNIEGKVFRYVVDLEPGDELALYVDDIPYVYYVSEKYILKEVGMSLAVRKKNAQWIMPSGDERLTLVTCWPYEWPGNSHRVVVVARPASYFDGLADEVEEDRVDRRLRDRLP